MTQKIDLSKMGLTSMSNLEMQEIDGGSGFWDELASWAIKEAISHWDEIKAGFSAGYHAQI